MRYTVERYAFLGRFFLFQKKILYLEILRLIDLFL